jgi:hypothetical protein
VSGIIFNTSNLTEINLLEPGTMYYYKLQAIDVQGNTIVISADSFITKNSKLVEILPNVLNFTASVNGDDVALLWRNNFNNSNLYVRVVRSHLFYPSTIESGALVYEGRGESFVDIRALENRSPQYYTVFVLDESGLVSGGSVARADKKSTIPKAGSSTKVQPVDGPDILLPDIGTEIILKAIDITISQQTTAQSLAQAVTLTIGTPFMVSIPFVAVPKNLKSIIVSIQNPSNQREVSAYLLKLNQEGDKYQALIPSPEIVGSARITLEVFDYELATVRRISTLVTFIDTAVQAPFFPDRLFSYIGFLLGGLLFVTISLWLWWLFLLRHRSRD